MLGLGATDTHSPFLISILLIGALGVFAVVRAALCRPTWAAPLAGCLFAGPLFVEMFMDGSQGAIVGSAVLAPVVALGYEALRDRRTATLVLFALLVAGLQTVYPLFLPVGRDRRPAGARLTAVARFLLPKSPQPRIRIQLMMRRTQGVVKSGAK